MGVGAIAVCLLLVVGVHAFNCLGQHRCIFLSHDACSNICNSVRVFVSYYGMW